MSKRNVGTALGVLAAVTFGATAYAASLKDKDAHDDTLLTEKTSYIYYQPIVKAEEKVEEAFTDDVKATKIAGNKRDTLEVKKTVESLNSIKKENQEVVYENYSLDEEEQVEDTEEKAPSQEAPAEEEVKEAEENENEAVAEENSEADPETVTYQGPVEEKPVDVTLYVGCEALNVREAASTDAKIKDTLTKGEEVTGKLQDGWVETANGYVKSDLLTQEKPVVEKKAEPKEEVKETKEAPSEKAQVPEKKVEEKPQTVYKKAYVKVDALNVRDKAGKDGKIVSGLEKGDYLEGNVTNGWLEFDLNGKKAYVDASCLSDEKVEKPVKKAEPVKKEETKQVETKAEQKAPVEEKKDDSFAFTGWVNCDSLNIRKSPNTNSSILGGYKKGDKLSGTVKDGWLKTDKGYVIYSALVDYEVEPNPAPAPVEVKKAETPVAEPAKAQAPAKAQTASGASVASIAQQFAGYPYVWGSSNPSVGFDCSGLVYYAYQQAGVTLSRTSSQQFSNGYAVDLNNLQPGDLIFFSYNGAIDHVGMITSSDGTFIHAANPGTGVIYSNIFSPYYQSSFAGARRIF